MGRVSDAVDPVTHAPFQTWAFPYTQVSFRCTGTYIGVRLVNYWGYGRATLGAIVDGLQLRIPVPIDTGHDAVTLKNGYPSRVEPTKPAEPADMQHSQSDVRKPVYVTIAEQLPNIMHEVTIFKRQATWSASNLMTTRNYCRPAPLNQAVEWSSTAIP